jgi:type II secretory pathway pseudopilin PulG
MKPNHFNLNRTDEHGFIMVSILILGIVITISMISLISYFQSQNKAQARQRARLEITSLRTTIEMLLSSPTACKSNLTSGGFGASLTQLNALSSAGTVQVRYPPSSGPSNGVMISLTKQFNQLTATKIGFSAPVQLIPTDTVYLADLTIRVTDNSLLSPKPLIIPFYLVSDASGNLTDCFATAYVDTTGAPPYLTMEDDVCHKVKGSSTAFQPRIHACM